MSPKISFIMAGRNDDYGGNFLNRMHTSLRTLLYLAEKHAAPIEVVVIDYNPPIEVPTLREALGLSGNAWCTLRFISIPAEFHARVSNGGKNPFPEYIAKNIGIRRARGEYVASVNPDIIFSEAFFLSIVKGDLHPTSFYRANRHDLGIRAIDPTISVPDVLRLCAQNTVRIWTNNGSPYVSWKRWFKRFRKSPKPYNLFFAPIFNFLHDWKVAKNPNRLHDAASGDFMMMHATGWATTRGFDQVPFLSYVDGYHLHLAHCLGLSQVILKDPIYHVDHRTSNGTRPSLDLQTYLDTTQKMLTTGIPYKEYDANWGFPDTTFSETTA
ncbi:MAG: hypothetical protein QY311_01080 [Candidatus Paceibacterota bacterium]|nr:MAG: hypothetical protein QY311_01080 [Candidatus Paceibacterota bacterium]